jgi:signal transduction histidine kinase
LAGVAGGIADRLGVDEGYVRAAFVTATFLYGIGLLIYVIIWVLTFDRFEARPSPQLEPKQRIGIGVLFIGGMLTMRALGLWLDDGAVIVAAAISFGVAALWDRSEGPTLRRIIFPGDVAGPGRARALIGILLLVGGLTLLFSSVEAVADLGLAMLAVMITSAGLALAFGPWMWRMGQDLTRERRERIRQEERAEMAAHLHDSVLQTLALIQRSEDPRRMVTLARAQERELRTWLFDHKARTDSDMLSTAFEATAARIEDDHHVAVEVVTVGDWHMNEQGEALLAAATEAMLNAAKHSGAHEISVYLEVTGDRIDVWVGDQGKGFDQASVQADRRGIADSIVGRMERNGGGAEVVGTLGEGTEVHLFLPRGGS